MPPPPPPPPWGGPPAGSWPGGSGYPPYGTGYPPYGTGVPPYGTGYPPPYGAAPDFGRRRTRTVVAIVAVALVLLSAVAGGGVEYAFVHKAPSTGSISLTPGPTIAPPNIDTSGIAARVDPAIVDIDTTVSGGGEAAGTGMVITSSGEVLTNNHVIEDSTSLSVQIPSTGKSYTATVLGDDPSSDVALIQINGASGLKVITVGSSNVSVGTPVVAIGNALGRGGQPDPVAGTVTGVGQTITAGDPGTTSETLHGLIQTDAPIQRGDSGGPLVTTDGHVIGMDTAAADGGGIEAGASAAYSIPLSTALPIVQEIRSGSSNPAIEIGAHRPLLGVNVVDAGSGTSGGSIFGGGTGFSGPVAPVKSGALVEGVENPSPAATAGLSAGDVIVGVDNSTVSSAAGLESALLVHRPGGSVTVKWVDVSGSNRSATVQLTSGPPA